MLLLFIAFPDRIQGRRVNSKIDNMAVVLGWSSGFVKEDETASEILKAVHYLGGVHGVTVSVQHVGRVSDKLATLADELSRKTESSYREAVLSLRKAEKRVVEGYLLSWLSNPETGGKHCKGLLKEC